MSDALIVIDPQKGFCDDEGSLAEAYGVEELAMIKHALPRLRKAVLQSERCHLVCSRYAPGQFCENDLAHPLAMLCVPGANSDGDLATLLADCAFLSSVVKNAQSALSSSAFRDAIDRDIASGITRFRVAGFLLNHCVKQTACDLKRYLNSFDVEIVVCLDLCAMRKSRYDSAVHKKCLEALSRSGVQTARTGAR